MSMPSSEFMICSCIDIRSFFHCRLLKPYSNLCFGSFCCWPYSALCSHIPGTFPQILVSGPSAVRGWNEFLILATSAAHTCPKTLLYHSGEWPLKKWKKTLLKNCASREWDCHVLKFFILQPHWNPTVLLQNLICFIIIITIIITTTTTSTSTSSATSVLWRLSFATIKFTFHSYGNVSYTVVSVEQRDELGRYSVFPQQCWLMWIYQTCPLLFTLAY